MAADGWPRRSGAGLEDFAGDQRKALVPADERWRSSHSEVRDRRPNLLALRSNYVGNLMPFGSRLHSQSFPIFQQRTATVCTWEIAGDSSGSLQTERTGCSRS